MFKTQFFILYIGWIVILLPGIIALFILWRTGTEVWADAIEPSLSAMQYFIMISVQSGFVLLLTHIILIPWIYLSLWIVNRFILKEKINDQFN